MLSRPGGRHLRQAARGIRKKLWLTALPVTIALVSLLGTVPAYASSYLYSNENITYASGCGSGPSQVWGAEAAELIWQCDGNLVIYCIFGGEAVWSSETDGSDGYLAFQSDGNLVIYGESGRRDPIWSTGTNGNSGDYAVMQDDSNFVIYSSTGRALWASGTNGRC